MDHPILFSGEMVRAILEGRKTQTRRVINPQPPEWIKEFGYTMFTPKGSISGRGYWKGVPGDEGPGEKFFKIPYGVPGDRLWVRETYQDIDDLNGCLSTLYRADDNEKYTDEFLSRITWRPSIFMPRNRSRITLEIINIRVERLRDITQSDAKAEGAAPWWRVGDGRKDTQYGVEFSIDNVEEKDRDYVKGFRLLWDHINAKRGCVPDSR